MEFHVIIPARFQSSRLPGKVLADIQGKPMVQHVYERALSSGASSVVIATDDARVEKACLAFGAKVCMTSDQHPSGTERIHEVIQTLQYASSDIIVGLQADEPEVPPEVIHQLALVMHERSDVKMASLYDTINSTKQLLDPHVVKVVLSRENYAMYFSRAPIPWERINLADLETASITESHCRHVGLYAYRAGFLNEYMAWPRSPLESIELLEQLRILWNGGQIYMSLVKKTVPPGVDTAEDLERARNK